MKALRRNSKVYDFYFRNDTFLERLYNTYIHQTLFDRVLDVLVFFAIIFTLFNFVLELSLNPDSSILHFFHVISIWVILIFAIDLIRHYAQSKTKKQFLREHWLDLILVVFFSLYFLFTTYFGVSWFKQLTETKKGMGRIKTFRAFLHLIKR